MKTLVICGSHLYVPTLLSYLYSNDDEILICTDRLTIYELFSKCTIDKVKDVYYDKHVYTSVIDALTHPRRIMKYKKSLLAYYHEKKPDKILFFHDGYCQSENWLMLKLSKDIPVYFCPVSTSYDKIDHHVKYTLKNIVHIMMTRVIWNYRIKLLPIQSSVPSPFMAESFYKRLGINRIDIPVDLSLIQNHLDDICPEIARYVNRVVILQCDSVGEVFRKEDYEALIDEIITALGKNKVVFKAHPDFEVYYGQEKELDKIPIYISANIILEKFPLYLGSNSTVLAEAAGEGLKAISYLKMLPAIDEHIRDLQIEYLNNICPKVYFPETKEEFFSLLNDFVN